MPEPLSEWTPMLSIRVVRVGGQICAEFQPLKMPNNLVPTVPLLPGVEVTAKWVHTGDSNWTGQINIKEAPAPPVCPKCKGKEQVWGIRFYDEFTQEPLGWMGISAFLQWTGSEIEAHEGARASNAKPHGTIHHVAEQLRCPKCGKTNNPRGESNAE